MMAKDRCISLVDIWSPSLNGAAQRCDDEAPAAWLGHIIEKPNCSKELSRLPITLGIGLTYCRPARHGKNPENLGIQLSVRA
jgi:hypothetical protein